MEHNTPVPPSQETKYLIIKVMGRGDGKVGYRSLILENISIGLLAIKEWGGRRSQEETFPTFLLHLTRSDPAEAPLSFIQTAALDWTGWKAGHRLNLAGWSGDNWELHLSVGSGLSPRFPGRGLITVVSRVVTALNIFYDLEMIIAVSVSLTKSYSLLCLYTCDCSPAVQISYYTRVFSTRLSEADFNEYPIYTLCSFSTLL